MSDETADVAALKVRAEAAEGNIEELWVHVNRIRDRPPVWIMFAFSCSTFLIGFLLNALLNCLKP